jgi:adenosine deaminase
MQYLATFEHTLAVMQTEEHIERVAYEAAIDLSRRRRLRRGPVRPELHEQEGLTLDTVVRAVTDGFRRGERDAATAGRPIWLGAILCAMRTEHGRSRSHSSSTGCGTTTTRCWRSTSPAPRPASHRPCTPRR